MPRPSETRPFLKWAGGKRQLLSHLRPFYPRSFNRYYEPFLGSGAVFFDLHSSGRLQNAAATLSDENGDLIGTYLRVRDSTEALIAALEELAAGHTQHGRAHYYAIRDQQFNPGRDRWRQDGANPDLFSVPLAAMFLYLNRTGYNGLFRLNAAGHFNVPAGSYDNPPIVNAARLRAAAAALTDSDVSLRAAPFEAVLHDAGPGDFVYLDPPYAPLSATANFRSYTARGFSDADQTRLRDIVVALANKGAVVLVSNSTAPSVVALYDDGSAQRAGLHSSRVPARRSINTRGDRRGVVEELCVTNAVS